MKNRNNALTIQQINNLEKNKINKIKSILINKNKRQNIKTQKSIVSKKIIDPSFVFFSGGIGDVIAIESFLSDTDRENLQEIFYASNKNSILQSLFSSLNNYKNLQNHTIVWNDFSKFWCFYTLEECLSKIKNERKQAPRGLIKSRDLSIYRVFSDIKNKKISYNGSSFLNQNLANIEKFDLPKNYTILLPFSNDKRSKNRDFDANDWNETFSILRKTNSKGVIINRGSDVVPDNDLLINLSNKTTIQESIEILKFSSGFVGIDSWLSILAAKIFNNNIQIKSINKHLYENADCYYAPLTNFSFIKNRITYCA